MKVLLVIKIVFYMQKKILLFLENQKMEEDYQCLQQEEKKNL